jgi:hypothetical protein
MPSKPSTPWIINDRVLHQAYGPGTVVEINMQRTTIEFDSAGRRKFVTSMVQLEKSDVAAPPPPKRASRARTGAAAAKAAKAAAAAEPGAPAKPVTSATPAKPAKAARPAKSKSPKKAKAAS